MQIDMSEYSTEKSSCELTETRYGKPFMDRKQNQLQASRLQREAEGWHEVDRELTPEQIARLPVGSSGMAIAPQQSGSSTFMKLWVGRPQRGTTLSIPVAGLFATVPRRLEITSSKSMRSPGQKSSRRSGLGVD